MKGGLTVSEELRDYFSAQWELEKHKEERVTLTHGRKWLEAVFKKSHKDDEEFKKTLTDGLLLCRLINKIIPNTVPFANVGRNPIKWLENVQFFLDGCRRVGLKEDMLFEPYDVKYVGNDTEELERRNQKIAVTLFWLSRIATHLPPFNEPGSPAVLNEDLVILPGQCVKTASPLSPPPTPAPAPTPTPATSSPTPVPVVQTVVIPPPEDAPADKKIMVATGDTCNLCNRTRAKSESALKKPEDGNFTLLLERSDKGKEFGISIKESDTGYPIITYVIKGSYAHKSGLQEGDYVLTVNGINTANMSVPTVNERIKSVFTEGHVYIGICRLPPNETLSDKHKESALFKNRAGTQTDDDGYPADVPIPRSKSMVDTNPVAPGPDMGDWRSILEKHKRENSETDSRHAVVKDLWNKYIKLNELDNVASEVSEFDINKANKFKESVAQTDGNDSLDRHLTLVGHKLKERTDVSSHTPCGICAQPLGTKASIHLDNTTFTYHQACFNCKHCNVALLDRNKLQYNVFVVDGQPYCDVCIRKMGMIRLGKVKKTPIKTTV